MKVYAEIKEPATCPGCGRAAQPGDLLHISIAFGEGRHLRASFRCRSCCGRFETESLGPDADGQDAGHEAQMKQLETTTGISRFLAELRRAENESGQGDA